MDYVVDYLLLKSHHLSLLHSSNVTQRWTFSPTDISERMNRVAVESGHHGLLAACQESCFWWDKILFISKMSAKGFCEYESFKRGIKEQDKFLQFISTLKVNNNNIINNNNNHYSSYNNVVSSRNGSTTSGFDQLEALCALLDERQNRMGDLLATATTDPPPASMENTSPPAMMIDGTSKDLESSRSMLARRHSLASMEHQPDVEKNRKEKSPWGKVKNIISTRRDSSRKRSCPQEPSWRTKNHSATKERRPRFCQSDDFVGQMPTETKKDNLEASISTYDHLLLPPMDLQFTEESQSLPGSPSRVSTVFFYDDQMFEQGKMKHFSWSTGKPEMLY
ncbi:uncharacterized protein LOC131892244 [Tigriopus californicus]|uniref:uncharacterized protein LOC131892244 n=1 Tax=Tigriopus californicus TaxID=6832 RepID=UPI0027DA1F1F|nr:uncharacterized protein LOC131892244 [Tigriopus californicus]